MNKRTGDYQTLNKIGEGVLTKAHIHYIWDPQNWYVHEVKKMKIAQTTCTPAHAQNICKVKKANKL